MYRDFSIKMNRILYLKYQLFVQIRRSCKLLPLLFNAKFANDTEICNQER